MAPRATSDACAALRGRAQTTNGTAASAWYSLGQPECGAWVDGRARVACCVARVRAAAAEHAAANARAQPAVSRFPPQTLTTHGKRIRAVRALQPRSRALCASVSRTRPPPCGRVQRALRTRRGVVARRHGAACVAREWPQQATAHRARPPPPPRTAPPPRPPARAALARPTAAAQGGGGGALAGEEARIPAHTPSHVFARVLSHFWLGLPHARGRSVRWA
jgi:hypothetical protein